MLGISRWRMLKMKLPGKRKKERPTRRIKDVVYTVKQAVGKMEEHAEDRTG